MSSLSSHTAAGQALGYLCQVDYALLELTDGLAAMVGIETLDDVAVVEVSGKAKLIQSKATTTPGHNPLSDSSVGLWKTLDIWLTAIVNAEIDPTNTRLLLVTNAALPDCLALRFSNAKSPAQITAAVQELMANPSTLSKANKAFVDRVRQGSDTHLRQLVQCIGVIHGDNGLDFEKFHLRIVAKSLLPDGVDPKRFLHAMLGWLHATAMTAWTAGRGAWVRKQDFNNTRQSLIENLRRRTIRAKPATAIVCKASEVASHRRCGFVRQLEIIDADGAVIDDAIADFLKHNEERLRLVREGHVVDQDWIDFEERLFEYWKPIFRSMPASPKKAEQRRQGQRVYGEVQKHRESLRGEPTEEFYLTRGAYQRLADALRVGWHPKFSEVVKP